MFNKVRSFCSSTAGRIAAGTTALLGSVSASAAVPAVIGTEITAMQTDALAVVDLVWPFVLAVLGAFVLIKIVKRGANKA